MSNLNRMSDTKGPIEPKARTALCEIVCEGVPNDDLHYLIKLGGLRALLNTLKEDSKFSSDIHSSFHVFIRTLD